MSANNTSRGYRQLALKFRDVVRLGCKGKYKVA